MERHDVHKGVTKALVFFAFVCAGLSSVPAGGDGTDIQKYAGGTGTTAEPYRIESMADWTALAATPADWNKRFVLGRDIDFGGASATPVGTITTLFTGTFDGDGHVLRNLVLSMAASENVGLFGYVGNSGVISDLRIENATVTGLQFVGGLAGRSIGQITGCHVTGVVSLSGSGRAVGGLVGCNYARISACSASCTVTGAEDVGGLAGINIGQIAESHATAGTTGERHVGGLAGTNSSGTITSCHATGPVSGFEIVGGLAGQNETGGAITSSDASGTVTGRSQAGGLVGKNAAGISSCHATGPVNEGSMLGGLAGNNLGTIAACRAEGPVTGDDHLGGLVGINAETGSLSSCFAVGPVTAEENGGGLVSRSAGSITDCYARGDVDGVDGAAGLVQFNSGTLENCYATGKAAGSRTGGLVAAVDGGSITACYWDTGTSGLTTSAGGEGRITAEMVHPHGANTFTGWNFTDTWVQDTDHNVNDGYPYLLKNEPPVEESAGCGCATASCGGDGTDAKREHVLGDWLLLGSCLMALAAFRKS